MGTPTKTTEASKFEDGNGADGKHYWLTPPDLYAALEMQPGKRPYPMALAEARPLESLYTSTTTVKPSLRCSGALFEREDADQ